MITPRDLVDQMLALSKRLDASHELLTAASADYADADAAWHKARSRAYLQAEGTVAEKTAQQELATNTERRAMQIADGIRTAALESCRSLRAQLSALQSISNAVRSEAELAGRY